MSRISFLNRVIDGNNFVKIDATVDPANMTIYKNGVLYSVTVYNNGDGYYYFEGDASAEYALRISGAEQDEFKEIYCTVREDNITEQNLDPSPEKGDIEMSGNYLQVHDGANMVLTTDIIDTLISTETDQPLSANQGKVLKDTLDALADTDITNIVSQSDINSDLSTGGATKVVSAEVLKTELNPNYANPKYISDAKTIVQNLERLDQALREVITQGGMSDYRNVYCNVKEGVADGTSAPSSDVFEETSSGAYMTKIRVPVQLMVTDTRIVLHCEAYRQAGSADCFIRIAYFTGGSQYYSEIITVTDAAYAAKSLEIDVTTLLGGGCVIEIQLYGGATSTIRMRYPELLIYRSGLQ